MAGAALFGFASNLLSTIASEAFELAYEKAKQAWRVEEDLDTLKERIEKIQAVLLDAEKKQEVSASVKDWVERARNVLYDAEDLFDEIAIDAMPNKRRKTDQPPGKKDYIIAQGEV